MSTKRHVLLTMIARSGGTALTGLTAILIAQDLGASGLGLFGLLRAVPAVLLVTIELGITSATPYLVNQRKHSAQTVFSMTIGAALIVGLLGVLIWVAISPLLGAYILRELPSTWLLLAGLVVPALAIESAMTQILRAKHLFEIANSLRWGLEAVVLAIVAVLVTIGSLETWMLVPCLLGAHFILLLFGASRVADQDLTLSPKLDWPLLKESVHFGIRSQIGNSLNMLNYRMDHLILSAMTDLRTVGIYVVASKAAEFFRVVTVALTFVLEPQLAAANSSDAIRRSKRLLLPAFLANFFVVAVAWFLGPLLIPILFDEWSIEAMLPYQLLLAGLAARGTNGILVAFNLGQGVPQLTTYASIVGFALTVVLDITLIPRWQAVGAAIASSAAQAGIAAVLLASFWIMARKTKNPNDRMSSIPREE